MQESEITADISDTSFHKYIDKFTKSLGEPEIKRRISFMILQRGSPLDNRIKITNGKARIVQKLKNEPNSSGKRVNEEVEIDIPDDLESVKLSIRMLQSFYRTYNIETLELIVQHENYIWEDQEFELKISRQFGNSELFVYEIETHGDKTPEYIQDELGIKPDYDTFSKERQALRRDIVDIRLKTLSNKELDALITKYLGYK
jgi:hypothetical protein